MKHTGCEWCRHLECYRRETDLALCLCPTAYDNYFKSVELGIARLMGLHITYDPVIEKATIEDPNPIDIGWFVENGRTYTATIRNGVDYTVSTRPSPWVETTFYSGSEEWPAGARIRALQALKKCRDDVISRGGWPTRIRHIQEA